MDIKDLKKKKIAVLGMGVNNQALVLWLLRHEVKDITILDKNPKLEIRNSKQILNPKSEILNKSKIQNLKFQTGKKYLDNLEKFDVIFRTPGIPYLHPKIQKAKKDGVEISSQTKLFFDLCPAKIIGITGTKGKGTTAVLIYKILQLASEHSSFSGFLSTLFPRSARSTATSLGMHPRPKIYLAGNIGTDPFEFLDKLTANDWVILELSSFQLQDLEKNPHIAVVLNITSDHLDYHKNTKEYVDAKLNIVRHQKKNDYVVINLDYLTSFKFAAATRAEIYYFSFRKSVDLGTFVSKRKIILRTEEKEYKICKTSQIKLLGKHNLENICAAITVSYLAGADIKSIKKVITTFVGREHRLEFVREYKGIKFYNDSASTNPDTAIAAIKSFSAPIILIAGGSDKGADYSVLGREILNSNAKTLIIMGETGPKIVKSCNMQHATCNIKMPIIYKNIKSLESAVKIAKKEAKKGDIVLLSPASASFDMFENYEERGERFKKIVKNIR